MTARIFKPAKTAMQSGLSNTAKWLLVHNPQSSKTIDPVMGWTGAFDMLQQVRLSFATKEEAIAYAERHGLAYLVEEAKTTRRRTASYSDNFKFSRLGQWTH